MLDFGNAMVILGAISFIILPFILKIKTIYKIVFIICAFIAMATTLFESSDIVNIIASISLLVPFIISRIIKEKIFIDKEQ